jgi:predicted nuclease of predicted toxin-antitoxin system
MRVLLDECLPRRLGLELTGHFVSTVQQAGWAGISNGKLLTLIADNYDAFLTVDKNLAVQQITDALPFGVIVLRASSNRLADLRPLVPQILTALTLLQPGTVVTVAAAQV